LKNTDNVAITVKAFHCEPAGIGGLRSGISIKSFWKESQSTAEISI